MSGSKNYGTFTQWNSTQQREERISELQDRSIEIIQSEEQREKTINKNE